MARYLLFVFLVWSASYLGLIWLDTLLPMEHIYPAIVSAWFACWLAGGIIHETD